MTTLVRAFIARNDEYGTIVHRYRLDDGRQLDITSTFGLNLSDKGAAELFRRPSEQRLAVILRQEQATGRYVCCGHVMPGHHDLCQAVL